MLIDANDCEAARIEKLRCNMVENQIRRRGVDDPRVLAAMLEVPREIFVPASERDEAYADWPLPIGFGQTISQPYTVAFMAEALKLDGSERVLEVGTGSGYAAAVLSRLAKLVYTVERIPKLAERAKLPLGRLGYGNVQVLAGDGTLGLKEYAPFDAIVVAAGAEELPEPYGKQLVEGGRILIPIGPSHSQSMYRITKRNGQLIRENFGAFAFVPLVGQGGSTN